MLFFDSDSMLSSFISSSSKKEALLKITSDSLEDSFLIFRMGNYRVQMSLSGTIALRLFIFIFISRKFSLHPGSHPPTLNLISPLAYRAAKSYAKGGLPHSIIPAFLPYARITSISSISARTSMSST